MRINKLFLWGVFLLTLLLIIGNVSADCYIKQITSAVPLSESERIIMEVSGTSNAHGKIYSGSPQNNHFYVVCPMTDVERGTSRTCKADDSTLIIRLNKPSNSHAEAKTHNPQIYGTKICYDSIKNCKITNLNDCDTDYFKVVSLSSQTNAHIGQFSEYPTKICCTIQETCTDDVGCDSTKVGNTRGNICSSGNLQYEKCELNAGCYKWIIKSDPCSADRRCSDGDTQCKTYCGNGVPKDTTGEECDDGNLNNDDGCDNTCKIITNPPYQCINPPASPSECLTMYWASDTSGTPINPASVVKGTGVYAFFKGSMLDGLTSISYEIVEEDQFNDQSFSPQEFGNPSVNIVGGVSQSYGLWNARYELEVIGNPEFVFKSDINGNKKSNLLEVTEDVTLTSCSDGIEQDPNDAGFNEECEVGETECATDCTCNAGYEDDSGSAGCVLSVIALSCHDYCGDGGCDTADKITACTTDVDNAVLNSVTDPDTCEDTVTIGDSCPRQIKCNCIVASDNKCKGLKETLIINPADPLCTNSVNTGSCILTESPSSDDCSTSEFISIDWTGSISWAVENSFSNAQCRNAGEAITRSPCVSNAGSYRYDPEDLTNSCVAGTNLVQCPSRVKLDFFNWTTFITTLIFLVVVYLVWNFLDKKRKK